MKKKVVIGVAAFIAIVSLVTVVVFGSFVGSFKAGNYYIVDDELFDKARGGLNTVYLAYNSEGELVEVFNNASIIGSDWVALQDVGKNLINGFISAEDRDFYSHHGVNVKRTLGAIFNHIFKVRSRFGASTITQQVIKNISGNNEASAKRKFNEILRSVHLENLYSKEEILEVYLNVVPMTGNIAGVALAARTYFGKPPSELSVHEAATIVGITNAPGKYNPYAHPSECLEKRNRVLYAMLDNGVLDREEYEREISEPLGVIDSMPDEQIYSWFVEVANNDVVRDIAEHKGISRSAARIMLRGCRVVLTESPEIQSVLEEYFENTDNLAPSFVNGLNYSFTVIDNRTGNLVGIIGGAGKKKGNNLLNLSEIQIPPASTIKPLSIYAPLIESGEISWSSVIDDTPIEVSTEGDFVRGYPVNSPNVYSGLISVNDALRLSKNTVAAKIYNKLGSEKCRDGLERRYGLSLSERDRGIAPLALGQLTYGVSLRTLTEAYSAFAREGIIARSNSYLGVFDSDGRVVVTPNSKERRIYSVSTARIMNQLLMNVVADGTARSITLKDSVDTAGKTGTSSGNYDRLFIGYTPYYTAGIWMGYPTRERGVDGADATHLRNWDEVMKKIHNQTVLKSKNEPDGFCTKGLLYLPYCLDSGEKPADACRYDVRGERIAYGYFADGHLPQRECYLHEFLETGNNCKLSAPHINRDGIDGITVTDGEYDYDKLTPTEGFDSLE